MEASLEVFGFLDLMLIHWPGVSGLNAASPQNAVKRLETWRVLEQCVEQGRWAACKAAAAACTCMSASPATSPIAACANQHDMDAISPPHGKRLRPVTRGAQVRITSQSTYLPMAARS